MLVNKVRVLLPMSITVISTIIFGIVLDVAMMTIIKLIMYDLLFEFTCYWLSNRKQNHQLSSSQINQSFKAYVKRTQFFIYFLLVYIAYKVFAGSENTIILFYLQVLVMFYAIGYILSMAYTIKERG